MTIKDYILPLIFLKRLSDVFEDEVAHLGGQFGGTEQAAWLVDQDHQLVRFYVPAAARWPSIATRTTGLGEYLTDAVRIVARENPRLQGVIDAVDFNATTSGQRNVDDQRLAALAQVLGQHRLGLDDVDADIFGRAYEYLLRKFAEGQGQSAGEDFTPPEAATLLARLLEPEPGMEVYDSCCGSGGLLIKCHARLVDRLGEAQNGRRRLPATVAPVRLYGQDPYDRFRFGAPPSSSADWGWLQHMLASLKLGGRMAVVLDTGAVSRGSGNQGSNRERDIRRAFVEGNLMERGDLIEAARNDYNLSPSRYVASSDREEVLPLKVSGR